MIATLKVVGLLSMALGALSGFAVLMAVERPDALRRRGIRNPKRILQLHLDWVIMGILMVVVALAVPALPAWAATLVLIGGIVNPATFIPMAFGDAVLSNRTFQTVSYCSFVSLTVGLFSAVGWAALG